MGDANRQKNIRTSMTVSRRPHPQNNT